LADVPEEEVDEQPKSISPPVAMIAADNAAR
jgi:hypothetical protein